MWPLRKSASKPGDPIGGLVRVRKHIMLGLPQTRREKLQLLIKNIFLCLLSPTNTAGNCPEVSVKTASGFKLEKCLNAGFKPLSLALRPGTPPLSLPPATQCENQFTWTCFVQMSTMYVWFAEKNVNCNHFILPTVLINEINSWKQCCATNPMLDQWQNFRETGSKKKIREQRNDESSVNDQH